MSSEEKYRLLFENAKEAVFMSTPDGRVIDMNPAGVEMFGYASREEMLSLKIDTDLYADPEERKLLIKKIEENGYVKDYRIKLKRKDGTGITVLTTVNAVRDEKGFIMELHGMHHEITEREREKEELKEDLERLDFALQSANMGVWHWDFINQKIDFDKRSLHLLGIDESTFNGSRDTFYNAVHPDDRGILKATLAQAIERHEVSHKAEYRVIWPDGSTHYIVGIGKVFKNNSGNPVRMHGLHWDVTDYKRAEQALAESEERLKSTLEAAHIIAWEINADGSHHEAGPVDELFGKPKGFYHPEVSDLLMSIHPDDREAMKTLVREALEGRKKYYIEFRAPQEDGSIRWIEATGTLLRDARGRPVRILGIAQNVTERKLAEKILLESENRTRGIINAMPIGIHMYRLESDKRLVFTGANPEADRILGVDHNLFIGKLIEEAFPVLAYTDIPRRYREVARSGNMWQSENIRYKYGSIAGAFRVYAFQTAPNNMAAAFEDITEPKKVEDALRRSEERFRRLVEHSNDIIVLLDEQAAAISINGPLERVLGYKPNDLDGKSFFELLPPDYVEKAREMYGDLLKKPGSSVFAEFQMRHKNGKWVAVEAVGSNFMEDANINAIIANIRDISERTRLQEQLQQATKMEAIGRLAGGIAHDFNNLLTVISGNIQLAKLEPNVSESISHYISQIAQASDRAAALTRQLLAFSRRQIIEPKVLNLNDLILNVKHMLVRLIGENIELSLTLCEDLGNVKVDPGQFEQALVNLAVNAVDAMPSGGKLLIQSSNVDLDANYCSSHPDIQPGAFVMLAVSDTGHGMSEDVKEHIFEPFFTT